MIEQSIQGSSEISTPIEAEGPSLLRHTTRDGWGLGLVLRRMEDRQQIQFQDGRMRTLHLSYEHLLETVDRPYYQAIRLVEALKSMAPEDLQDSLGRSGPAPITMDEQLEYFRRLFPEGFQGEAYAREHRGDGRKLPLKRHRDAPLNRAKEKLSREGMACLRREGGPSRVFTTAKRIVNMTGLVRPKERRAFGAMPEEHYEAFASALHALLHGSAPLAHRFDHWVAVLDKSMGQAVTWELATLLLGSQAPQKHAVVAPSVFALQAKLLAPGLRTGERPMGILYARLQTMIDNARDMLVDAGLAPRDLMDVHDFMSLTLKSNARVQILERRSLQSAQKQDPVVLEIQAA